MTGGPASYGSSACHRSEAAPVCARDLAYYTVYSVDCISQVGSASKRASHYRSMKTYQLIEGRGKGGSAALGDEIVCSTDFRSCFFAQHSLLLSIKLGAR